MEWHIRHSQLFLWKVFNSVKLIECICVCDVQSCILKFHSFHPATSRYALRYIHCPCMSISVDTVGSHQNLTTTNDVKWDKWHQNTETQSKAELHSQESEVNDACGWSSHTHASTCLLYKVMSVLSASSLLSYQLFNWPKMTYGHLQCWLANSYKTVYLLNGSSSLLLSMSPLFFFNPMFCPT